jgi:hypothetical protein
MTDTENFKKVIVVLIDAPKAWRLCLTSHGHWYDREKNKSKEDIVSNLDWAVRELVGKGDYALAVWGSRPEVKEAWFDYHYEMVKHYLDAKEMEDYEEKYPHDGDGLLQLQRELNEI